MHNSTLIRGRLNSMLAYDVLPQPSALLYLPLFSDGEQIYCMNSYNREHPWTHRRDRGSTLLQESQTTQEEVGREVETPRRSTVQLCYVLLKAQTNAAIMTSFYILRRPDLLPPPPPPPLFGYATSCLPNGDLIGSVSLRAITAIISFSTTVKIGFMAHTWI